jgi:hypothetical protein
MKLVPLNKFEFSNFDYFTINCYGECVLKFQILGNGFLVGKENRGMLEKRHHFENKR